MNRVQFYSLACVSGCKYPPPNRLKVTACHLVLDSGCAENVQLNTFWHIIDVEKQLDVTSLWRIYCKSEDFFLLIQRTAIPLANRSVY